MGLGDGGGEKGEVIQHIQKMVRGGTMVQVKVKGYFKYMVERLISGGRLWEEEYKE